jgi:hypothetical protein
MFQTKIICLLVRSDNSLRLNCILDYAVARDHKELVLVVEDHAECDAF